MTWGDSEQKLAADFSSAHILHLFVLAEPPPSRKISNRDLDLQLQSVGAYMLDWIRVRLYSSLFT